MSLGFTVTAGEGFDAPGYVRISYATSMERLREGCDRLMTFLRRRERTVGTVATS